MNYSTSILTPMQQLQDKDRALTAIARALDKKLRTANALVAMNRAEYFQKLYGLEVGALVINENSNSVHHESLFVVSRIDVSGTTTYGKRRVKPWAFGRLVIDGDPNKTAREETHLFHNWRVYEPEPA